MSNGKRYFRPSFFGGYSFFPPVIKNLMIINGIVFLLQFLLQGFWFTTDSGQRVSLNNFITEYFALMPLGYGFLPWQLITFQFMHGGFNHILFNMLYLWLFGLELENNWGSKKFLIYYLTCGVGAGLTQLFISPLFSGPLAPTVGASGGIYGVLLAFAIMFPDRPVYIYFLLPIKAKYLIGFMILIEFFSVGDQSLTAHLAHIGGAVTGIIYILIERHTRFSFDDIFSRRKFRSTMTSSLKWTERDVSDAHYYEIESEKKADEFDQKTVDDILDKINKVGYQNLTNEEKRILYEASKKIE
ncbi:MAG: rhomboid family intramembrane serine protease [Ignavibacteria bacterium]|nr:rhomboid family intramembrane serine protease [Ignavibacteria bacterium]